MQLSSSARILSCILLSALLPDAVYAQQKTLQIHARRGDATMDRNHFEKVVAEANRLLARSGCNSLSLRVGTFGKLKPPNQITDSEVDTNQKVIDIRSRVERSGGNIGIVSDLRACGSRVGVSIAGCAGDGTIPIIEIDNDVSWAAKALLHEIKHFYNISWTIDGIIVDGIMTGHVAPPERLMHRSPRFGQGRIIPAECNRVMNRSTIFDAVAAIEDENNDEKMYEPEFIEGEPDLKEVSADHQYVPRGTLENALASSTHGIDWETLEKELSNPDNSEELKEILKDANKSILWPGAIEALKIYGDSSDLQLLEDIINNSDEITDQDIVSKIEIYAPDTISTVAARVLSDPTSNSSESLKAKESVEYLVDIGAGSYTSNGDLSYSALSGAAMANGILQDDTILESIKDVLASPESSISPARTESILEKYDLVTEQGIRAYQNYEK